MDDYDVEQFQHEEGEYSWSEFYFEACVQISSIDIVKLLNVISGRESIYIESVSSVSDSLDA